jgi:Domain of unknown function (DUF6259)
MQAVAVSAFSAGDLVMRASSGTVTVGVATRAGARLVASAVAAALVMVAPGAGRASGPATVQFDARGGSTIVVTGQTYRLALAKRNGAIVRLDDRASGTRLVRKANRCLWGSIGSSDSTFVGGCSFAPTGPRRFSYRWDAEAKTLTLTYGSPTFGSALVTIRAQPTYLDLRLTIRNESGRVQTRVQFPAGLAGDTSTVTAGYAPNVLPGVRLAPAFFSRVSNTVEIYPSRWAFADYLALDVRRAHVALYSVVRGPLQPVQLGFVHLAPPAPCSGSAYCVIHEFQTWIGRGASWTSPVVRLRIGDTPQQSTLDYRHDNGIDAYPSLKAKLGTRLDTLARAPLIKANLPLLEPFRDLAGELGTLPSPLLLHPVGFQSGGHDVNDPDFLPPDPRQGTDADFAGFIAAAHAHDDLVMPYGNLSWWDPASPTMQAVQTKDVAVLDSAGEPQSVTYGPHTGVIVSPYAPLVLQRAQRYMEDWRTSVPADCVFLDQVGARPWLRDFNPASPDPLAYDDGWLAFIATYRDRCVMVEDGWDRLARDAVGFHGSLLMMSRELGLPDQLFGAGNWEPYPLADWLFHDKVLLYQHDLFEGTMAIDDEVITWNMAFGLVSSYSWDAAVRGGGQWLSFVAALQRALGPLEAGLPLSSFREVTPDVSESTFGDLVVVANQAGDHGYSTGGFDVAPHGFLARTRGDSIVAGSFAGSFDGAALSPGTHHLLVQQDAASVTVRQLGPDTDVAVRPATSWSSGRRLEATALAPDGTALGSVGGAFANGVFTFHYAAALAGRAVAEYRVTPE